MLHYIFHCTVNVVVFLLYVQRISRDVRGHTKKNIEQKVVMHLSYQHILLPTPQFAFVNSELVFFQMVPHRVVSRVADISPRQFDR